MSSADRSSASRLRMRLTAAAESVVRSGHPWVFANSVREQNRPGTAGELAVIYDRRDKFLAVGLFDPDSPIRVRVLQVGKPVKLDASWWAQRLAAAVDIREGCFASDTTGYRLINGESDGWPGLVLDRYGGTLVLKIYTSAWGIRLQEVIQLVKERLMPERIVLRLSRNVQCGQNTVAGLNWKDGDVVFQNSTGSADGAPALFLESGLRFEADVVHGQKTGFFLDQRENRRLVATLAGDRSVLNAFSFSGGFSLSAAHGGAKSVTDLDISQHALESAERNFALNQNEPAITRCRHECIQTDAFKWLTGNLKRQYDLVILDPPSLAKRESERARAIAAYRRLARDGLQHLASEGILVACSCSAHVTAEEFFAAVRSVASTSGRQFVEIQTTGHPVDHPAKFIEARYLKAIFLRSKP